MEKVQWVCERILNHQASIDADSGHTISAYDTITPPPPLPIKPPRVRRHFRTEDLQDNSVPAFLHIGKLQEGPQRETNDKRKTSTLRVAQVTGSRARPEDEPPPPHWVGRALTKINRSLPLYRVNLGFMALSIV